MKHSTVDGADFMPAAELAPLQAAHWRVQSARVAGSSTFFQRLWGERRPPERLADLPDLPLCDKQALRADQRRHPPFGSYLACAVEDVLRLHRTSGTSGEAMNLALDASDCETTARIAGRAQSAAGLRPGDRVVHCLNYQLWMGGLGDHMGLEATGAMVVPFGVGSTQRLVHTIRELGITAISCTPSYPAVLEQVLEQHFPGLSPRDLGLRLGLFGGESGLDDPAFRARLEQTWGFAARNSNYGVSDVLCNLAGQCAHDGDLHFVGPDVLWPELVDADSGEPIPWRAGETGELVLTHLHKHAQPLVRFRSGDIVTVTAAGESCRCGRTASRFRVVGRADDMVVVRGINVFPGQVAAVINAIETLSGEYRIVLVGQGPWHYLPLEVERADSETLADDTVATHVAACIKQDLGVRAEVRVLPARALPRSEGKTRRVLREK